VPDNLDSLEWMQGQRRPNPSPETPLVLNLSLVSGNYRGHIIDGILTLYHKGLKKALDAQGVDNIDYFPVILRNPETEELDTSYFLANILGLLDCVDMAKSEVNWWPSGRGFDFLSMVIDESKTHGAKIFRLAEDPTKVIINEDLKRYFDESNILVGVKLIQTEDYRDF
jgi:hypothetical protein